MAKADVSSADIISINLSRLLSRLEKVVLSPGSDDELLLRKSSFERRRVGANLDYARTLLLQLEQESLSIRVPSKRQSVQADLADRKELITRLNDRLYQLNQFDDEDLPGEDEDLLVEDEVADGQPNGNNAQGENVNPATSTITGSLGQRTPFKAGDDTDTQKPDTSSQLFGARLLDPNKPTAMTTSSDAQATLSQNEKLLSHNRTEQEDLTSSLLQMAQALKASSQAFANSLESEKEILERASEGLDKNTAGMEAAEKRMSALRRMTEGRGWLGRMLMYLWIAGLWVVALIIVIILPKLRF